jgi:hypothetical protein
MSLLFPHFETLQKRQFNSLRFTSHHTGLMAVGFYCIVFSYCSCPQTIKHPIFMSWFILFRNVETIPNSICFTQTCSLSLTLAFSANVFHCQCYGQWTTGLRFGAVLQSLANTLMLKLLLWKERRIKTKWIMIWICYCLTDWPTYAMIV